MTTVPGQAVTIPLFMPPDKLDALPPHDRRRFFAAGLARLVGPLSDYIEKKLPPSWVTPLAVLRPPGALPEADFLNTCHRCGKCADACPANAISLTPAGSLTMSGTPFVDPTRQACVICDDLSCMKVCPSGALSPVDRFAIRMGLARVDHDLCVRSKGNACTICVDACPIGSAAMRLDEAGQVLVIDPNATGVGCTGCGVCEQLCPTRPVRAVRGAPRRD